MKTIELIFWLVVSIAFTIEAIVFYVTVKTLEDKLKDKELELDIEKNNRLRLWNRYVDVKLDFAKYRTANLQHPTKNEVGYKQKYFSASGNLAKLSGRYEKAKKQLEEYEKIIVKQAALIGRNAEFRGVKNKNNLHNAN